MNIISSVFAPKTYKYTLSALILNLLTSCRYMSKTDYCEGGFHDEPRFSFLKFNILVDSLQHFEYEYNYKKRS